MYESFEHTADIGLRVRTGDLPRLFEQAAAGLFSVIVAEQPKNVTPVRRSFTVPGSDLSLLLFDWLNELLFAFDTDHVVFSDFRVHLTQGGIEGSATARPIDPDQVEREVKAITYHGLRVEERDDGWYAEFIVDI